MNLIAMLMLAADPGGQPLPDVVLLDFTASYCQPCREMAPVLQRMKSAGYPIRVIDFGKEHAVSREYNVDRIPTFILLVEGNEVNRFVGFRAEQELRQAMNDAAKKLDQQRKAAAPPAEPQPAEVAQPTAAVPKSGLRNMFDRMKSGLGGERTASRDNIERPDFRAQSPDEGKPAITDDALAMQSTVRVRLDAGEFKDVGTGTIIHSVTGQSTILTCAHMFKDVTKKADVEVEVFRNGETLKYAATVLGGNHDSDLAFLRIKNTSPLPMAPLQQGELKLKPNDDVFSIGCNGGKSPTLLRMNVKKVGYFEGPQNILCTIDPVQGRSGGGLFNVHGELVGVCSGAFRESKEGLYTGVGAARELMAQLKLNSLFETEVPGFAANAEKGQTKTASFEQEADPFDQLFDDNDQIFNESAAPFAEEAAPAETPAPPAFETMPPDALTDPFAAAAAPAIAMATSTSSDTPTEITVIIDSNDPTQGKQVVVIPRPSPWLLELLTGKSQNSASRLANIQASRLSTTSARPGVRKPPQRQVNPYPVSPRAHVRNAIHRPPVDLTRVTRKAVSQKSTLQLLPPAR